MTLFLALILKHLSLSGLFLNQELETCIAISRRALLALSHCNLKQGSCNGPTTNETQTKEELYP